MFLAFLSETAVWGTDLATVADVYLSDLICFMPIVLCNILAAKVPLFRRNPKTGEEEKAFAAVTMAVQALLIAAVLVLMGKPDAPGASPYLCAFGTGARVHQYLQPADKKGRRLVGNLRGVKAAAVCIGRTALLWGARVRDDVTGIVIAFCCIVAGFLAGNADEEKI